MDTPKTDEELAQLAATHRRAAEVYERQIEANNKAREPEELPRLRKELAEALMRIVDLEDNIRRAGLALGGIYDYDD